MGHKSQKHYEKIASGRFSTKKQKKIEIFSKPELSGLNHEGVPYSNWY